MSVSALFVRPDGPYPRLVDDWWDVDRDATKYAGPNAVVAHPPCKRWGRFWWADGSKGPGNDGGLFASALENLRRWGGVLEHPEASHAWRTFDIPSPPMGGGWMRSILQPNEWTTCVPQRNYGHRARKLTWLIYVGGPRPPLLNWSRPAAPEVYLCPPGRRAGGHPGDTSVERMRHREREVTPEPFARLLISIAEAV